MEYVAANTKEFLKKLGIHYRLTSVGFPLANQKAGRSVGTAKRVIRDAIKSTGELNTAIRNTPNQDSGLSPLILLGRDL